MYNIYPKKYSSIFIPTHFITYFGLQRCITLFKWIWLVCYFYTVIQNKPLIAILVWNYIIYWLTHKWHTHLLTLASTSVRGRDICVILFADITPKGSGASAQCPVSTSTPPPLECQVISFQPSDGKVKCGSDIRVLRTESSPRNFYFHPGFFYFYCILNCSRVGK